LSTGTDPAGSEDPFGSRASRRPGIRLFGTVDNALLDSLLRQLDEAMARPGPLVLEMTTSGGNADTARRMALEMRLAQESGKACWFFGKTMVYSAGVTVMAAFPPARRVLSADTVLLLHERHTERELRLSGALRASLSLLKNVVAELEAGQALEREGFEALVRGSSLTVDELMARVMAADWYLPAAEAQRLGLVSRLL